MISYFWLLWVLLLPAGFPVSQAGAILLQGTSGPQFRGKLSIAGAKSGNAEEAYSYTASQLLFQVICLSSRHLCKWSTSKFKQWVQSLIRKMCNKYETECQNKGFNTKEMTMYLSFFFQVNNLKNLVHLFWTYIHISKHIS